MAGYTPADAFAQVRSDIQNQIADLVLESEALERNAARIEENVQRNRTEAANMRAKADALAEVLTRLDGSAP